MSGSDEAPSVARKAPWYAPTEQGVLRVSIVATAVVADTDAEAWMATLRRLPPRSPRRDRIVRHLEWLETEYGEMLTKRLKEIEHPA